MTRPTVLPALDPDFAAHATVADVDAQIARAQHAATVADDQLRELILLRARITRTRAPEEPTR
ncbi:MULTISPECIES: hypothetical protein [unclassified Streptomyces]|uniref:hypothetical protein n=1 Tax=unclassified Streptomyces TaxID=2593676 RepID=UPI00093BF606|nr:hypothetical protein [Streptomyces sp. CB02366]OKJ38192.1 hypothetical protein AMK24_11010 [Streptomyces sp. CB02366]